MGTRRRGQIAASRPVSKARFQEVLHLFDRLAAVGYSDVSQQYGYGAVVDWVRSVAAKWRDRSITLLDIGCADGQIGAVLAEQGITGHFTGIDLSEKMLEHCARRRIYSELIHGDLHRGLGTSETARFNVVTACGVLEFIEDAGALLEAVRQVMTPSAELLITFEEPLDEPHPALPPVRWKFPRTEAEGLALLDASGFAVCSTDRCMGYQAVALDKAKQSLLSVDVQYVLVRATPRTP